MNVENRRLILTAFLISAIISVLAWIICDNVLVRVFIGIYASYVIIINSRKKRHINFENRVGDIINNQQVEFELQIYEGYVKENMGRLSHFMTRLSPYREIRLSNKYVLVCLNMINFANEECIIGITDKIAGEQYEINLSVVNNKGRNNKDQCLFVFASICELFNYETSVNDIMKFIEDNNIMIKDKFCPSKIKYYIDINQASEAELTAIPGISVAKAKKAIKMRTDKGNFWSLGQFLEEMNLSDDIIDEIQTNGNKIPYNKLPKYNEIEFKKGGYN